MSAETTAMADDEFRQRMHAEGDLGLMLSEHIWGKWDSLSLGGQEFEVVGCEEVPGYEDDDTSVFLRRKPDGKVFEVEIELEVRVARPAS